MKQEFLKIIEHFSERKAINKKTKISIFFVCFIISLFTWFLIKMSDDYTTDIDFPVTYTNLPSGQILTNTYDSIVTLKLSSRGFDLLNLMFFESRKPIRINLSGSNIRKNPNSKGNFILTRNINSQILRQVKFMERISEILPDTLRFDLEEISSKKVAVVGDIKLSLKPQYQLYGVLKITPDSVLISGPPSMIDSISEIKTSTVHFTNVAKNLIRRIRLEKPVKSNKLSISLDSVNVFAPIEKFTENIITTPINIHNTKRRVIKLFPENVKITYLIALKDYSNFQTDMISIGINFDESKSKQIVEVFRQPSFIKITNIEPETVEYIIIK